MFKYYFEQIHNVEIWPIISLTIFMIFFLCLLLWVFTTDKGYITRMKNLPFEGGDLPESKLNNHE
ncbi:cytochrome C oxidase Cbb3 [Fulvivirga lutea]|uniref:Cytochrome C oxidase Cbb3 n=1 Tax=Fulvivirga lutea TaxID=2810512 RepID=A0A974WJ60_9BACT|nr:cytochrome C oxidase Cbb3 [Fulvivirga lutea]QSE96303.1 cytochrome C oxidase Cbb3 [Fulvivirga lutea]